MIHILILIKHVEDIHYSKQTDGKPNNVQCAYINI